MPNCVSKARKEVNRMRVGKLMISLMRRMLAQHRVVAKR